MSVALTARSDYAEDTGRLVRDVVRRHRRDGKKLQDALRSAARELGLSGRRVRSYWYGEPVSLLVDEYFGVRERVQRHLHREAARLREEAALLDLRCKQIGDEA